MSGEIGEEGLGLDLPYLESAVGAAAAEEPAVCRPGYLVDRTHVTSQAGHIPTHTPRKTSGMDTQ